VGRARPLGVVWLVVGITLVSGVAYFWRFWRDVLRSPVRQDVAKEFEGSLEARTK